MGYPMARNLLRAGHEVALWSHTADKARQLAEAEGGVFCETPRDAGARADCLFVCVGDSEMSERVICGRTESSRAPNRARSWWTPAP